MQTLTWSPELQDVVRDIKKSSVKQNENPFKNCKSSTLPQDERDAVKTVYQNQQKESVDSDIETYDWWG